MEMRVERPEEPVALEDPLGEWADAVELVAELEPHPVGEAQMLDDELLPFGLRRPGCIGEDVRDRDRRRQSFAARDGCGRRQHNRGVAAAREADEAGAPCERRENCSSERVDRVALDVIGRRSRPGFAAEHETGGELERAQLERGAAERHGVATRAAPSGPAHGGTPRPGA